MTYAQLSVNAREIVAKFTLATSQEVQLGVDWYRSAFKIATRIADRYGLRVETAAGVIAALSPSNRWERNIIDAEAIIKVWAAGGTDEDVLAVKCCTYPAMRQKALDILTRDIPIVEILNGPKLIEFFNCITNPLLNDVCIDGHAYSIWLGQRVPTKQVPNIKADKLRSKIKTDYRDATAFINAELGEDFTAADIQAITWVTHKRIYGV
tara:strand:- start:1249 stop:1875 length:627 start_codon:yes stop_codon:yes gene_type:complete